MAAPKGNQFHKLRSKNGRDKLFATPKLLWEAACEYFEWVQANPLYEVKTASYLGEITQEKVPVMRVPTLERLTFYLHCDPSYFRVFKSRLDPENNETDKDFLTVITDIENIIYADKFEGAAANLLNANIIARDLGLVDKQQVESKGEISVNISKDESEL